MVRRSPLLLCVFITLGACEVVEQKLGLGGDASETAAESEPEPAKVDLGARAQPKPGEDGGKNEGKRKRKRRAARRPTPAETELDAALDRAIVEASPGQWRIDPFVLTLIADTLARGEGGVPFSRITPKERKAGAPASFRVGPLPKVSLWRKLGLRPDDLVLEVAGVQPPGPKGLAKLRERLPREGTLRVKIQRNGLVEELRYDIEPTLAWTRYLEVEGGRSFEAPAAKSIPRGATSARPPSGTTKTPTKPATVPVQCSGSTCTVPKWYFDSLVGSSSKAKQQMRGSSIGSGFKVSFVGPASRKAGFAVGDVITKVNGRRTNNQLEMLALYGGLKSTKKFRVDYLSRGKSARTKTILVEG